MGQTAGGGDEPGAPRAGVQGEEPADQSDGRLPDDHSREGHGAATCQHLPPLLCGLFRYDKQFLVVVILRQILNLEHTVLLLMHLLFK